MQLLDVLRHILEVDRDGRLIKVVDSTGLDLRVADIKFILVVSSHLLSFEQF